uniref:MBF1 domain-containing protein n=1 Tax=Heterorhabditis bacteriophora TaxID=37862 RepID=A0A1I7WD90_HETBA
MKKLDAYGVEQGVSLTRFGSFRARAQGRTGAEARQRDCAPLPLAGREGRTSRDNLADQLRAARERATDRDA